MVFSSLIKMYLGMVSFEFIQLGILLASWICKCMSFIKFGKFSAIISSNIYSAPITLTFSSPATHLAWMLYLFILFHRFLRLLTFHLQSFFSLLFRLDNFCCSIQVHRFFPLSSLVTLFFSFKMSIWLFLQLLFLYWGLLSFHFSQECAALLHGTQLL